MRVVCISDTHDAIGSFEIPDGDMLIHAGDLTTTGSQRRCRKELQKISELPHKYKLLVPGNHDWFFMDEKAPRRFKAWNLFRDRTLKQVREEFPTIDILIDQSISIEGYKIYGSPWQPWYWGWAFNFPLNPPYNLINVESVTNSEFLHVESLMENNPDLIHNRETAKQKWAEIPDDVNILITHSPPHGILDKANSDEHRSGCPELRKRIEKLESLRLHIFGHIHEARGVEEFKSEDGTKLTFVNAAIMTRQYKPINEPIVVDI